MDINWELLLATATAVWGVNQWKREMIGRKRAELAEQALVISSRAEQVISYSRGPFTYSGEGKTRPLSKGETEENRDSTKDTLYSRVERLNAEKELFEKLHDLWHVFRAYYGKENVDAFFKPFLHARGEILRATFQLIQDIDTQALTVEIRQKYENAIWEGFAEAREGVEDEIKNELEATIKKLEKFCTPHIRPKHSLFQQTYAYLNKKLSCVRRNEK